MGFRTEKRLDVGSDDDTCTAMTAVYTSNMSPGNNYIDTDWLVYIQ